MKDILGPPENQVKRIVELALAEDLGHGDATTTALIPPGMKGRAIVLAKANGVVAGTDVARQVFLTIDPSLQMDILISDGARIKSGDIIATVSGKVASILNCERTALNFLQRLSGIATQTAEFVGQVKGLGVDITDTRKTTPGLRALEKYAVRMGGGRNHRLHLGDGILIKDNHIAALRAAGMSLKEIVYKASQNSRGLEVEVEVTRLDEVTEAIEGGADVVMLDNMSPEDMGLVMSKVPGQVRFEASGGVNLANVRTVAKTGVHFISIGALTHSVKALDISLELEPETVKLE